MSIKNDKIRRTERREEAVIRQAEYDALDIASKVDRCVYRRGNSLKELAKIRAAV